MERLVRRPWAAVLAAMGALAAAPAAAQARGEVIGAPQPWGMGWQPSGGPIMDRIIAFNNLVFWIIVGITLFVLALLLWVVWRYRASANPTPARFSHNTPLEIVWTVIPLLILFVIAVPSFQLIYYQDRARDADLTIGVEGRQWYWHYRFPDHGNFSFDSYPVAAEDLRPGQLRNLDVDNPLVIRWVRMCASSPPAWM